MTIKKGSRLQYIGDGTVHGFEFVNALATVTVDRITSFDVKWDKEFKLGTMATVGWRHIDIPKFFKLRVKPTIIL